MFKGVKKQPGGLFFDIGGCIGFSEQFILH